MFVGMHALLSMQTGVPEIALTDQEGKAFMSAAQNVMRHYSVETTQKTLDIIAFMGVTAQIYAPRVAAYSIRKRMEAKAEHGQSNVVHMTMQPDYMG